MTGRAARPTRARAAVALLLGAVLASSLSGCFAALHAGQSLVAPDLPAAGSGASRSGQGSVTPTDPHAAIQASAAPVTIAAGTHAGDGTISTRNGAVVGFVAVVATAHGGFRVEVTTYKSFATTRLRVFASSLSVDPRESCFGFNPVQQNLGMLALPKPRATPAGLMLSTDARAYPRGDPSFLKGLVFVDQNRGSISCAFPVAATATLVWRLPDMNPGFQAVDGGLRAGARGFVADDPAHPDTYTAVRGDTLEAIANRFGITTDDLRWLNPVDDFDTAIVQDQPINLAPAGR